MQYLSVEDIRKNHTKLAHQLEGMETALIRDGVCFRKITSAIRDVEKKKEGVLVVDIGAGGGVFIEKLLKNGFLNIQAVDLDNYLHSSLLDRVKFHQADLCFNNLPFVDNDVDVVTALFILEHLENPWHFMREVTRVLHSGGRLVVAVPYAHSIWSKIQFVKTGNISGYRLNNNHITFLPTAVHQKFFQGYKLIDQMFAKPYFPYFRRLNWFLEHLPRTMWKYFAQQVCYIYEKNEISSV